MIDAPFSASAAASALASLAAVSVALGGILLMMRSARRLAGRALTLGATVAVLAGLAGLVFR